MSQAVKAAWHDAVLRRHLIGGKPVCAVTGKYADPSDPDSYLEAHHIVDRQTLRKHHLEHLLWDPRMGLPVSRRVHRRHTQAVERIPRRVLPADSIALVGGVGLGWWLEGRYPS